RRIAAAGDMGYYFVRGIECDFRAVDRVADAAFRTGTVVYYFHHSVRDRFVPVWLSAEHRDINCCTYHSGGGCRADDSIVTIPDSGQLPSRKEWHGARFLGHDDVGGTYHGALAGRLDFG